MSAAASPTTAVGWPGATAAIRAPQARVPAEHPDRRIAELCTPHQMFLRIDPTHELPLVVETEHGIVARFACEGDAAIFVSRDHKTLPGEIVLGMIELRKARGK